MFILEISEYSHSRFIYYKCRIRTVYSVQFIHVLQISSNICKFDIDLPPRSTSLCAVIKFTGGAGRLQGKIKRLQGFLFSHKNRLLPSLTHRCECWLQIQLYVNVNVPVWNKLEQNETCKQIQNVKLTPSSESQCGQTFPRLEVAKNKSIPKQGERRQKT